MRTKLMILLALLAVAVLGANVALAGSAQRAPLRVEIAEIGARLVTDPEVVDEAGLPTRGNYFVTEGYIYEEGTVTCTDGVCDGVVYDDTGTPSPEFPDRLIGTWTCWGTHTGDIATATTGSIVATTQQYDFGAEPGEQSVVTIGHERIDDTPIARAIVGETGQTRFAGGVVSQSLVGLNNPDLVIDGTPLLGVTIVAELQPPA